MPRATSTFPYLPMIAAVLALSATANGAENVEVATLLREARQDIQQLRAVDQILPRTSLGEALARVGKRDDAAAAFAECVRLARQVQDKSEQGGWLYQIALAQAASGVFPGAFQTFGVITDHSYRNACQQDLLQSLVLQHNYSKAMEFSVICNAANDAMMSDIFISNTIFDMIRTKDFDGAVKLLGKLKSTESIHQCRNEIGRAAASQGNLRLAMQVIEGVPDSPKLGYVWLAICEARAAAGQRAESREAFERARRMLKSDQEFGQRLQIVALAKMGDFAEAIRTWRNITPPRELDSASVSLVQVLADAGEVNRALELSREIKSPDHRAKALQKIAIAQEKVGDLTAARRTLTEVLAIPQVLTTADQLDIAKMQHRLGDRARAAIRLQEALNQVGTVSKEAWRNSETLSQIAVAQFELGYTTRAGITFQRALEILPRTKAGFESPIAYENLVRTQVKLLGPTEITKWVAAQPEPQIRALGRLAIVQGLLDRGQKP